jgi:hypothetical protein
MEINDEFKRVAASLTVQTASNQERFWFRREIRAAKSFAVALAELKDFEPKVWRENLEDIRQQMIAASLAVLW